MKRIPVLSVLLFCATVAHAQEVPVAEKPAPGTPDSRMQALEEQVHILAEEVALLRGELKELRDAKSPASASGDHILLASARVEPGMVPAAAPAPVPGQVAQTQTYGGATSNAKLLNPDISMIGNFIGTMGPNPVVHTPSLELRESELGVQAIIDPYARGDFFLSFGEQGVNVEEGYITFTSLPAGLLLKVGKMRAAFGKVNMMHSHVLPWIDRPTVTRNLVGGEDGIDDAGISLSRILPAPKNWFLEGTAQLYRGDSSDVFHATTNKDVSVVGNLRAYKDLSESTNLDLGFSYARGHNFNGADFLTNLYDASATLRWKPLRRAIYHSFLFRTELIWSAHDQLSSTVPQLFETQHAFGTYADAEYRLNRRWTVGGRFDRSGHASNGSLIDTGFSAILTYWPSEFSQIRGQYRFGNYGDSGNANQLLFQFLFVLGAHGAHQF